MSGEIEASRVRLMLSNRPEAARLVRGMSTAVGEVLGFDPELLSDVNTAVSEACNNVIQHAYGEGPGTFSVDFAATPAGIGVQVRDYGRGIRHTSPENDGLKVGLALMSALADRAEFIHVPDGGTEVRLWFRRATTPGSTSRPVFRESSGIADAGEVTQPWRTQLPAGVPGDVVLTVSPVELLGPVLGRIGRALAPSAGFSLARCADVYLVSDALGAHAAEAADSSSISVALAAREQRLEFALSPLRAGTSGRLDGGRPARRAEPLASLTDEVVISGDSGHETLQVAMTDHSRV